MKLTVPAMSIWLAKLTVYLPWVHDYNEAHCTCHESMTSEAQCINTNTVYVGMTIKRIYIDHMKNSMKIIYQSKSGPKHFYISLT